jgi:protein-tyrosine phosphatase
MWLCGKQYVGPNPDAALAAVNADAIVCLCERAELAERFPAYVAWLEATTGERAVWFPIPDLHAPDPGAARRLLGLLRQRLAAGDRLVMHCGAGIGRAGTMAAALLITMGVELTAALATVAGSRPMAGPEAGAQMDLLVALAAQPG